MKASQVTKANDEKAYNDFLLNYPYDDKRKNEVQGIMQRQESLLTKYYDDMIKSAVLTNPTNNKIILYRIWAFSVCDILYDEMNSNDDERQALINVLNRLKNEVIL